MSTRSYICKENEDGTYTGIYCHSDGYLTHNGAMLIDHFNSRERVEKLISLGDMSILAPKIEPDPSAPHGFDFDVRQDDVCVFYGRDRGETGTESKKVKLEDLDGPDSWIEFIYIFGKDNVWRYFEGGELNKGLKSVQEGLDKEYEEYGFPRPADYYGFYSQEAINELRKEYQKKQAEMA